MFNLLDDAFKKYKKYLNIKELLNMCLWLLANLISAYTP